MQGIKDDAFSGYEVIILTTLSERNVELLLIQSANSCRTCMLFRRVVGAFSTVVTINNQNLNIIMYTCWMSYWGEIHWQMNLLLKSWSQSSNTTAYISFLPIMGIELLLSVGWESSKYWRKSARWQQILIFESILFGFFILPTPFGSSLHFEWHLRALCLRNFSLIFFF